MSFVLLEFQGGRDFVKGGAAAPLRPPLNEALIVCPFTKITKILALGNLELYGTVHSKITSLMLIIMRQIRETLKLYCEKLHTFTNYFLTPITI